MFNEHEHAYTWTVCLYIFIQMFRQRQGLLRQLPLNCHYHEIVPFTLTDLFWHVLFHEEPTLGPFHGL